MGDRYQVVGECAHVVVTDHSGVAAVNLLYKGAFLPDGVDEARLRHLLASNLVAKVEGEPIAPNAAVDQDPTVGIPSGAPVDNQAANVGESGDSSEPTLTAEQQAARMQLPSDGSAPDGRKSDAVIVEWLVIKGYDRTEVEKADRAELRKLLAAHKG